MIIDKQHYKLTTFQNTITIKSKLIDNNWQIIFGVYRYDDINFTYPIVFKILTLEDEAFGSVVEQGKYFIIVQIVPAGRCQQINVENNYDKYLIEVYHILDNLFIKEIKEYLCECINCEKSKISKCDNCEENNDIKNKYDIFTFFVYYILNYYKHINYIGFRNYLEDVATLYDKYILDRFNKMFNRGYIRGDFKLNEDVRYLFLAAIYVYVYLTELDKTDDKAKVFYTFEFDKILKCLEKENFNYFILEDIYFKYNVFGSYYVYKEQCSTLSDCEFLYNTNLELFFTKKEYETGINVIIQESQGIIALFIPKIWGIIEAIYDDANIDIKDNFKIIEYNNYFVYLSKERLPKGNYFIKLKFYNKIK